MLSVPHYLGSTLQWPTFIILSLEGLYLQQRRLAVIVFCTIQYWVCACEFLSKKKTVCVLLFVTRRLLAALIHKAFGTCFRHLFLGPSPLWLSTFSKETWQQSRCECVYVWLCVITFCIPPPLQVSVCWCLMGGLQKTLPGRCTWSSTRTAGEGPSLRWRSLLLRLLSFNLSAHHAASPSPLPATAAPPHFARHAAQTCTQIMTRSHMYSTCTVQRQTYSHPAGEHCSFSASYGGGGVDICITNAAAAVDGQHSCLQQQTQQRKIHFIIAS